MAYRSNFYKIMNPPKYFYKNFWRVKRSFTLFETLVAISVILTGLVSVMSLVRMSISTSSIFQNRITASNLAQEGIELVANKTKSNFLTFANTVITNPVCDPAAQVGDPDLCNPAPFDLSEQVDRATNRPYSPNRPGPCVSESKTGNPNDIGCYIIWRGQTDIDTAELIFEKCDDPAVGCPRLNFDESTGLYSYDSSAEPTQFVRTITVDDAESRTGGLPYEYDELYVTSSVTWPTRFGSEQKVEFSTYLSL